MISWDTLNRHGTASHGLSNKISKILGLFLLRRNIHENIAQDASKWWFCPNTVARHQAYEIMWILLTVWHETYQQRCVHFEAPQPERHKQNYRSHYEIRSRAVEPKEMSQSCQFSHQPHGVAWSPENNVTLNKTNTSDLWVELNGYNPTWQTFENQISLQFSFNSYFFFVVAQCDCHTFRYFIHHRR